jgi:hypothetical protein
MLPILRILPVGGVFLAIVILVLAIEPPGAPRPALPPMRVAMADPGQHPEWRQFLIQAALRRDDELKRLRQLPDTPTIMPRDARVAVLPAGQSNGDLDDDDTGSIADTPSMTIPVDIGETSIFELPVAAPDDKPPVIKAPQPRAPRESRKRLTHRAVRATPAAAPTHADDPFAALFGTMVQRSQSPRSVRAPNPRTADTPRPAMTGSDPH